MSYKSISLLSINNDCKFEFENNIFSDDLTVAQTPVIIAKEDQEANDKDLFFNFEGCLDNESEKELPIFEENVPLPQADDCKTFLWENGSQCNLLLEQESLIPEELSCEEKVTVEKCEQEIKIHLQLDSVKADQNSPSLQKPSEKRRQKKKAKTGLRKRKDVVFKALLRKIRSYYWKNFNYVTHYNLLKKKNPTKGLYLDCLKTFLETEFRENSSISVSDELVLTLGDLMTSEGASG